MKFEDNRKFDTTFKAEVISDKLLDCHRKEKHTIVTYFGFHGDHMWKDVNKKYLAYYEDEIKLIKEVELKVA